MIEFKQVSKRYVSGFDALNQVNFSLASGELAFLTGHSGAGKSTMFKLIALIDKPTAGEIIVDGKKLSQFKRRDIAPYRAGLGLLFQQPYLLNDRSVFDNVALPLIIQGTSPLEIKKRVSGALEMVGLKDKGVSFPEFLSGGEQQRVGIARAIVHKPKLILADEPTGNLDPTMAADVMNLFSEMSRDGMSILIATHDLPLIASMKHRIMVLKKGRL